MNRWKSWWMDVPSTSHLKMEFGDWFLLILSFGPGVALVTMGMAMMVKWLVT